MNEVMRKKVAAAGGFYAADYSNPEDVECILESFGGEENLKQNYPLVHRAFLKTVETQANRIAASNGNIEKDNIILDMTTPVYIKKTGNYNVNSEITTFLSDPDMTTEKLSKGTVARPWQCANITAQFYDKADPSFPIPGGNAFFDKNTNQFNFASVAEPPSETIAKRCYVSTELNGIKPDGTLGSAFAEQPSATASIPIIHSFTVTDPASKTNKNPIIMLYGRDRSSTSAYIDADYYNDRTVGGEYYSNFPNNKTLKTLMPMSGVVELQPGCKFTGSYVLKDLSDGKKFIRSRIMVGETEEAVHFKTLGNDQVVYDKLKVCFKTNTTGVYPTITFNIKGNWSGGTYKDSINWLSDITGVGDWTNKTVTYMLNAGFMLNIIDPNGATAKIQISISSRTADKLPTGMTYYKSNSLLVCVPPIEIHWGCFARETLIRLHTGMDKRIDELVPGDKAVTADGKVVTLKDIVSGEEKIVFAITTENGTIRLTGGHPVMMDNGTIIAAGNIKPGDVLKGPNGRHTVSAAAEEEYEDLVMNPVFENSGSEGFYILAGGFYCGDYNAQNRPAKKAEVELTEEQIALVNEFESLTKQLSLARGMKVSGANT